MPPTENSVPYLSPAEIADATGDYAAIGLSKRARKRNNRALLKAGALILPHEEARLTAPAHTYADEVFAARCRRITEALARSEQHDRNALAALEAMRKGA